MAELGSARPWRFEDGPTTAVARTIAATPEELWRHVGDITLPVATSPELQRVEWLDGADAPTVGARFVGHNQRGDLTWAVTCEVTVHDPPHALAWTPLYRPDDAGDPEPLATWRFDLAPVEDGTRVTQSVLLGPGRSGLTWAIRQRPDEEEAIVRRRLEDFETAMAATLDHLTELVARP